MWSGTVDGPGYDAAQEDLVGECAAAMTPVPTIVEPLADYDDHTKQSLEESSPRTILFFHGLDGGTEGA